MKSNNRISAFTITLFEWGLMTGTESWGPAFLHPKPWLTTQHSLTFWKRLAYSGPLSFIIWGKAGVCSLLSDLLTSQYSWINGRRTLWTWLSWVLIRGSTLENLFSFPSFKILYHPREIATIVVCLFQTHLLVIHHLNPQAGVWTLQQVLPQRWSEED